MKRGAPETTEPDRKIKRLRGPACDDPTICSDAVDVISLQQIWVDTPEGRVPSDEISELFSYEERHDNGRVFIRGFSLESLRSLLASGADRHPVSSQPIPPEALKRARELTEALQLPKIEYSKDFASLRAEDLTDANMEQFALEIFQVLASHSIFISEKIFMQFRPNTLTRLCLELRDLMKQNLPPSLLSAMTDRRPSPIFTAPRLDAHGQLSLQLLRQFVLSETRFVLKTATPAQAPLAAYIFVGALAAVSAEVRRSFSEGIQHEFETASSDSSESE